MYHGVPLMHLSAGRMRYGRLGAKGCRAVHLAMIQAYVLWWVIGHGFVYVSRRLTPHADVTPYWDTAWIRVCYGWLCGGVLYSRSR